MIKLVPAIALLAVSAAAQTPKQPFCDRKCWASISIYSGGSAADLCSSVGLREKNPFMRRSDGTFSPWKGVALKSAGLALTFAPQKKHPRAMFWIRTLMGVADVGIAWRNWTLHGRR